MQFVFSSRSKDCGIVFYDGKQKEQKRVPFEEKERRGLVYTKNYDPDCEGYYLFYEGEHLKPDFRAKMLMPSKYGEMRGVEACKALCRCEGFDWREDCFPRLEYKDSLFYTLHVRGFTMDASSGVKNRGSFLGIMEKIPYLKEIGVTTLELQPAYEFNEISAPFESAKSCKGAEYLADSLSGPKERLNYWGYKRGFYYAPKSSYGVKNACVEFKELMYELHKNNMELVMQFYFPEDFKRSEIPDILHYWVEEYHVDGFHLMGSQLPIDLIAEDDALAETKLIYYNFPIERLYSGDMQPYFRNLAEHDDNYMYTLRRFLKGDDNMLNSVLEQMRHIPVKAGRIHYLTNYNTLTMMDMVTYDYKHNEENGEENADGNDYNASWNCGEEGPSRKKKIRQLRLRQIKNAYSLLLLTQSTPKIFMGDEFGNTQRGNNNPYCQDNSITRLDWTLITKNQELFTFWRNLVAFRKEHRILHPEKQLLLMDTSACGYPDLSYHSEYAWKIKTEGYIRHAGMMFAEPKEKEFIYVAMNMHWDSHEVGIPKLPAKMHWQLIFDTSQEGSLSNAGEQLSVEATEHVRVVPARSIQIYKGIATHTQGNK